MFLAKMLWIISLIVLPFMQGGYFYFEKIGFTLIQIIVFLILLIRSDCKIYLNGFRKWLYIYLFLVVLSPVIAIDKGMQIFNILGLVGLIFFVINLDSFVDDTNHVMEGYVLLLWIMSMVTLIAVFLFGQESAVFDFLVQGNRIGGFFQYANAFAIFYLLGIVYMSSQKQLSIFTVCSSILFTVMIVLTDSRMVLVIIVVYYLIVVLMTLFSRSRMKALVYMLIGGAGLTIGNGLLFCYKNYVLESNGDEPIRQLTLTASEWLSRVLYYEDGLRMLWQRPLGYGHLGYYYSQSFFQTGASYKVKHIHSSFLQSSLDYGLLAGFVLLILGGYSGYIVVKRIVKEINNKQIYYILIKENLQIIMWGVGMSGLFIHTCFDFDLQFLSIFIVLIIGLKYMEELQKSKLENVILLNSKVKKTLTMLFGLTLIGVCVWIGILSYLEYEDKDSIVLKYYPGNTEAVTDIINARSFDEDMPVGKFKEIVIERTKANNYYSDGFAFLRDYYYNNGDLVSSLEHSEQVLKLKPLWNHVLITHAKITLQYVRQQFNNELLQKDDPRLLWLMNVESYMRQLQLEKSNTYNIKHKVDFSIPAEVNTYIEEAINLYKQIKANGD